MSTAEERKISENQVLIKSTEIQFDTESYDIEKWGAYISEEAFLEIIQKLNKLSVEAYFESRKQKPSLLYKSTKYVIFGNIIISIIFCVWTCIDRFNLIIPIIWMLGGVVSIFVLMISVYNKKITQWDVSDEYIKKRVEQYLTKINEVYKGNLLWEFDPFAQEILITINNNEE